MNQIQLTIEDNLGKVVCKFIQEHTFNLACSFKEVMIKFYNEYPLVLSTEYKLLCEGMIKRGLALQVYRAYL